MLRMDIIEKLQWLADMMQWSICTSQYNRPWSVSSVDSTKVTRTGS